MCSKGNSTNRLKITNWEKNKTARVRSQHQTNQTGLTTALFNCLCLAQLFHSFVSYSSSLATSSDNSSFTVSASTQAAPPSATLGAATMEAECKSSDPLLVSDVLQLLDLLTSYLMLVVAIARPKEDDRDADRVELRELIDGGCGWSLTPYGAAACSRPRPSYTRRTA